MEVNNSHQLNIVKRFFLPNHGYLSWTSG